MIDKIRIFIHLLLLFPLYFYAQNREIAFKCEFINKENPVERSLIKKTQLKVIYQITNISENDLLIPQPDYLGVSGNPSAVIVNLENDTLKCIVDDPNLIPVPVEFEAVSFIKLPSQRTIRYILDVFDGCDFDLEDGVGYALTAEFRSRYHGRFDIDGKSISIWSGTIKSKPINFKF